MSDCSQHPKQIMGTSDMEYIAELIGNLHYKTLSELLYHISNKLALDGAKDVQGGRKRLAKRLSDAADLVYRTSVEIEEAWKISEPFMNKTG